ncbi:hypothetical protein BpHYR1_034516 [Brachionus plicatilis]|uniref:Uncharacterized protein n=1 Tax=Brachionus plicatilis TaxID=10195 RepID=A0A3M7RQ38_BRAPC|nr:hypothetical protein BpHYR1_034516 [Brachionus plicatilis]
MTRMEKTMKNMSSNSIKGRCNKETRKGTNQNALLIIANSRKINCIGTIFKSLLVNYIHMEFLLNEVAKI